jgi:hypothetical protein
MILMKKSISREPPSGVPEGTEWFGGPVDRFRITLRILGDDLDPDQISALLGCAPTMAERVGVPISLSGGQTRIPKKGRWSLQIDSRDFGKNEDVDDGIRMLLARLPSSPDIWASLTKTYAVDIFCGLFLSTTNRGFSIPADISALLSDRGIDIGFDVYFDPPNLP